MIDANMTVPTIPFPLLELPHPLRGVRLAVGAGWVGQNGQPHRLLYAVRGPTETCLGDRAEVTAWLVKFRLTAAEAHLLLDIGHLFAAAAAPEKYLALPTAVRLLRRYVDLQRVAQDFYVVTVSTQPWGSRTRCTPDDPVSYIGTGHDVRNWLLISQSLRPTQAALLLTTRADWQAAHRAGLSAYAKK